MPKDTRSFFERLTGSVKIDDTDSGEKIVEIEESPLREIKSLKQENPKPPKKKIFREPEAEEESSLKTSFFAKTASKIKEKVVADREETALPTIPYKNVAERKNEGFSIEKEEGGQGVVSEDRAEVEGQLTVDIYDDGERIVIQSTVAGVKPEDLDVSITNDMVTIRGRRRKQEEVKDENYYYRELYWGAFSRSVILPEEIEVEKAEAALKNGLLTVKLPKKNKHIIQKIKVKME